MKKNRVTVTRVAHRRGCRAVEVHRAGRSPCTVTICMRCGVVSVMGLVRVFADWSWRKRGRRLRWTPANVTNQERPRTW
jgi:hypothetical protein